MSHWKTGFIAVVIGWLPLHIASAQDVLPSIMPYVDAIHEVRDVYPHMGGAILDDNAPLDDATAKFLTDHAHLFDLLHAGAGGQNTDWGIGDGTDMQRLISQVADVRLLANLAILRARWRFSVQDFGQGQEQLLDAMALGRNIAHDHPVLVVRLVDAAIEENVLTHWAKLLPLTPAAQLAALPDRLEQLPASAGFTRVMQAEQAYAGAQKQLPPAMVKAMGPFYDAAGKEAEKNPPPAADQFKQDLLDAAARLPDANSRQMAGILAPSFASMENNLAVERAYLEMFKTGISVVRDGPGAVQASSDLFGSGPFEYSMTAHGFVLKSKLVHQGKQVQLEFGE